jgi:nicotinamide-nucleotide amidase
MLRYRWPMARRVTRAELLAIGSELTAGETRDTNGGDLARELTALGVEVLRISDLPDDLERVVDALRNGLAEADLVVTTGGLGPTPDDLTREAIARLCGEEPRVDPGLEAWLEDLFARRGRTMEALNRKQAWLIPSASALPNPLGTAPGWWVQRPDGRLIVALPGPPREMTPMWRDGVLPRLRAVGLGLDRAAATLRLSGIGESDLAATIGEPLLRQVNPNVATYAREDAVDVRVSATAIGGKTAEQLVAEVLAGLEPTLARWVFARATEGWADAIGGRLAGRTLAPLEVGSGGRLAGLLGDAPWLARAEVLRSAEASGPVEELAKQARALGPADVGLAVRATDRGPDTRVEIGLADADDAIRREETAFLGGAEGRRRAALAGCAALWRWLAGRSAPRGPEG